MYYSKVHIYTIISMMSGTFLTVRCIWCVLYLEYRTQMSTSLSVSGYNSLLGVDVVGEVELLVTNEPMTFQWKDHGLCYMFQKMPFLKEFLNI